MPEQFKLLTIIACIFLGFPVYFLPAFIAAFTSRKTPSKEELQELQKLIDSYGE